MDKDTIMDYIDANYDELMAEYNDLIIQPTDEKIPIFEEFCEEKAIQNNAMKTDMVHDEMKGA
jgi:hypothetical protein